MNPSHITSNSSCFVLQQDLYRFWTLAEGQVSQTPSPPGNQIVCYEKATDALVAPSMSSLLAKICKTTFHPSTCWREGCNYGEPPVGCTGQSGCSNSRVCPNSRPQAQDGQKLGTMQPAGNCLLATCGGKPGRLAQASNSGSEKAWEPACQAHWGRGVYHHQTPLPTAVHCPCERKRSSAE